MMPEQSTVGFVDFGNGAFAGPQNFLLAEYGGRFDAIASQKAA